jgi:serine protease Do
MLHSTRPTTRVRPSPATRSTARSGLVGAALCLLALWPGAPGVVFAGELAPERQEEIVAARIMRVLPGVVGIITEVSAEVTIRCGPKDTYVVKPEASTENGTGFIIHPDGWIATNGHVVKPVHKDDEQNTTDFLEEAARTACGPGLKKLPEQRRAARMAAILKDPENRKGVKLNKRLEVFFPTGEGKQGFPAVVKAYSPPIDPDLLPKGGGIPEPPMLDAAIIKIEATNLPTVRLAPGIRQTVSLGQQLVIVGYPGVVVWHDFLSKKSRAESTVTFGRVSAFRLDVNERWIMQTDAPISWGNSGGPAFSVRGEVVGLATFISTSLDGAQAIQGFNFLIPIDSIHAMAKQIGLTPSTDSPFTRAWDQVTDAFMEGRLRDALAHAEAADQVMPGLIDVRRAIARIRDRLGEKP